METQFDQCPLCGTELSKIKFHEIERKLGEEEQRRAAQLADAELAIRRRVEQQMKKEFERQRQVSEKKVKDEADQRVKKIVAELDQATQKLKESQDSEAETRKQAKLEIEKQKAETEKRAKEEADHLIKKVASERDQLAKKLKQAQEHAAQAQKQAQEESDKRRQKELDDQRQALDKDKKVALFKQQSEFTRQKESFQKKIQVMENQLQKKTANELGDGAEIDLYETLRETFHGDKITRIPKGQAGADILHEVFYKGVSCGSIITDAKNRQGWQNSFVTKLRQDQVEAGAEHSILATTVFPAGKKEMCIESDVIVVSPARVVYITQLLRQAMVTMHIKGLSLKERSSKMSLLYKLITSESYSKKFGEAARLAQDVLELDVQEKKAHDNVWKKRGSLATRIKHVLREVETDVAAVIESSGEEEQDLPAIEIQRVAQAVPAPAPTTTERIAWNKH